MKLSRFNLLGRMLGAVALGALFTAPAVNAAEPFRYGVVEPKGDSGLIFTATKFGSKYGVDIKMVEFKSSTAPVKALISGDIDVFTVFPGGTLVAMSRGAGLKFVGCNWPGASYTLYGAADVKTMADLKGKSIGVSGPNSTPNLFAIEALRAKGMDPKDVIFANAGGGADRFRALAAGIVKATATTGEFEPEAAKRGLNILARAHDVTPNFSRNCIVTSDKVIATKRDQLIRFLAANMDGYDYALTHRDETIAFSRKLAELTAEDPGPASIYDEAVAQKAIDPLLAPRIDRLQWIHDMLVRNGVLDTKRDVKAFVDDAPRQAALKIRKP